MKTAYHLGEADAYSSDAG